MKKSRSRELLQDDLVRRWFENLQARSTISADIRLKTLALYCKDNNVSPRDILKQAQDTTLKHNFEDYVRSLERNGKAGSYIVKFKFVLKSWPDYNDIEYRLKINIRGEHETPTTMNERIPLKEELTKILMFADSRTKVSISIMAFSGCRPETLGNYLGSDGLTLSDLDDLDIDNLKFTRTPSKMVVRSSLSKAKHQYFTFLSAEAQKNIETYLKERRNQNEELTMKSPLIQLDLRKQFNYQGKKNEDRLKDRKSGNKFLRTMLITRRIKEAIRKAGYDFRPYVLRAYFITALDNAENKMLISHNWRLFFEGHKGDISARYSVNKGRLPDDMLEDMRAAFKRCLPLMSTENVVLKDISENDERNNLMNVILKQDGGKQFYKLFVQFVQSSPEAYRFFQQVGEQELEKRDKFHSQ